MTVNWRSRGIAHVIGSNVPHDGGIMSRQMVQARVTDSAQLISQLFEEYKPGFMTAVKPGDFIVAGENFGCGKPHTSGYLAMQVFGLKVVCESIQGGVARSMRNLGLPCLYPCKDVTRLIANGDEIEVDYIQGTVLNVITERLLNFAPMDPHVRQVIELGGQRGMLEKWLMSHPELAERWPEEMEFTREASPIYMMKEI